MRMRGVLPGNGAQSIEIGNFDEPIVDEADHARRFQPCELPAYRFDGQSKIIGDIGAAQRQFKARGGVIGAMRHPAAARQEVEEIGHLLLGGFAPEQ